MVEHMTVRISYEEREGIGNESFSEIGNQYSKIIRNSIEKFIKESEI